MGVIPKTLKRYKRASTKMRTKLRRRILRKERRWLKRHK